MDMGYPTSSRRGFPSRSRARALVGGLYGSLGGRGTWSGLRSSVRSWRPGRGNFLGLLAAYAILTSVSQDSGQEETTTPLPDLSGWSNICGPFPHPGAPYGIQIKWRADTPAPGACDAPLAGQAGFDNTITAVDQQLRMGWLNEALLPLERVYVYQHYGRTDAPAVPLRARSVNPSILVAYPLAPEVAHPPLTTVVPVPRPINETPWIPPPSWPQEGGRGYQPPRAQPDVQAPPKPNVRIDIRTLGGLTDVRSTPWEKERKVAPEFGVFFKLLGQYGSVNAIVNAMYWALPSDLQTSRTQYQRNAAVLSNLQEVDLAAFAVNASMWWVGYRAAAASIGRIPEELNASVGPSGFGLYRAWATGDFYYRGVNSHGNPMRINPSAQQAAPVINAGGRLSMTARSLQTEYRLRLRLRRRSTTRKQRRRILKRLRYLRRRRERRD